MMGMDKKIPDWFRDLKMANGTRERLAVAFSFTKDGYVRWYKGKTRFVCGRETAPELVEDVWAERKKEIDRKVDTGAKWDSSTITLAQAGSRFLGYLEHRVKTGQPKPLAPVTHADYIRTLAAFCATVGANRPLAGIGAADFEKMAKSLAGQAPSVFSRYVAYIKHFFHWCDESDLLDRPVKFGHYFKRAPQQKHRDRRLGNDKRFSPAEIQAMWRVASETERLWLALGLNGAMDNSDLSNFTADVIDWDAGAIDYRRRKAGKVRRYIPMLPETVKLLRAYKRPVPKPGNEHLFFVTPQGNPLVRLVPSPKKPGHFNTVDAVAQVWRKLMERAGMRQKPTVVESKGRGATRRRKIKYGGDADGRGFRSLRTSFPNLAPPGFDSEIEVIMGHQVGSVLVEHYLETFGTTRLAELVRGVWDNAFISQPKQGVSRRRKKGVAASVPA